MFKEGNTTKPNLTTDGWAQRLPFDHQGGSPYGPSIAVTATENHHQGLGLHKLVQLVRAHSGQLQMASGDCLFRIEEDSGTHWIPLRCDWKGVAISCRFRASQLAVDNDVITEDPQLEYIFKRLLEGNRDEQN